MAKAQEVKDLAVTNLTQAIEDEKKEQWRAEGRQMLFDAKRVSKTSLKLMISWQFLTDRSLHLQHKFLWAYYLVSIVFHWWECFSFFKLLSLLLLLLLLHGVLAHDRSKTEFAIKASGKVPQMHSTFAADVD